MKKVYQVGAAVPVRTYKEALRQHAKLKLSRYMPVWYQPEGCSIKHSVEHWGFKPLTKHGKLMYWSGLKCSSKF